MLYLIFLFFIFYFILAWRKLDWAVMLIILAMPAYLIRFQIFSIPMTILEAMILIAFFVWFIKDTNFLSFLKGRYKIKDYLENRKTRMQYPFGLELSLWVLIAWIAAVVAGFNNEALGIWKAYFFEPALFFILVMNVFSAKGGSASGGKDIANDANDMRMARINNENSPLPPFAKGGNIEKILWALAGSAFLVSVFAIYQKLTGNFIDNPLWQADATRRVVSFFGYPNAVGLYLGPVVMVLIGWLVDQIKINNSQETLTRKISNDKFPMTNQGQMSKSKENIIGHLSFGFDWKFVICHLDFKTIFILLTIIFSLLAIYFAKSEGALFGIVVALFIFGILAGRKLRWITIISALIIAVGLISYQPVRIKVIEKLTLRDLSGEIRKQQWRETWQMMTATPARFIFGTGLSGYQKAIAPYHKEGIFFNSDREPWEEFHRKTVFNEEYRRTHWQPVEIYMYPHNILLNFWTEMGIAGVLLFAWVIFKYFYFGFWILDFRLKCINKQLKDFNQPEIQNLKFKIQNYKNFRFINLGLLCAMIIIIVHGLVDVPYFKNDLAVMFWLLISMMSIIYLKRKNLCK